MTQEETIKQVDAIFALEGFEKTELKRRADEAVLSGRATFKQVADEMAVYAKEHRTLAGFIETRSWA